MKNKKEDRVKIRFSRKRILITLGYTLLSSILLYISTYIKNPELRYLRQFVVFFGFVALIFALISFGKLFTKEIRQEMYRRASSVMFNILSKLKVITDRIKSALGIQSVIKLRSDDEVRIIIQEDNRPKTKTKPLTKKRFSQLEDDCERIRFFYVKLLGIKQKQGKSVYSYQSPKEIKGKTADNETEKDLFDLYTPVRYAYQPRISPEDVKKQYDYFTDNGKKRLK